jgi:hypothetical protein
VGTCKYCGQPAGFLRTKHSECTQRHEDGKREIVALITRSLSPSTAVEVVPGEVEKIGERSFTSEAERHILVMEGWATAVERSLQDGVLSEVEEKRLNHLADSLSLSQDELVIGQDRSIIVGGLGATKQGGDSVPKIREKLAPLRKYPSKSAP